MGWAWKSTGGWRRTRNQAPWRQVSDKERQRGERYMELLRSKDKHGDYTTDLRRPVPQDNKLGDEAWERAQQGNQDAAKIKTYRMLRSLVDDEGEEQAIDGMLRKYTHSLRDKQPPEDRLEKAKEALAQAKCKLERSTKHLDSAQELHNKAMQEHGDAEEELRTAASKIRRASPTPPGRRHRRGRRQRSSTPSTAWAARR